MYIYNKYINRSTSSNVYKYHKFPGAFLALEILRLSFLWVEMNQLALSRTGIHGSHCFHDLGLRILTRSDVGVKYMTDTQTQKTELGWSGPSEEGAAASQKLSIYFIERRRERQHYCRSWAGRQGHCRQTEIGLIYNAGQGCRPSHHSAACFVWKQSAGCGDKLRGNIFYTDYWHPDNDKRLLPSLRATLGKDFPALAAWKLWGSWHGCAYLTTHLHSILVILVLKSF